MEATDDEAVEEDGEEAEGDCSKTVAATGAEAATSGAEADAMAVIAEGRVAAAAGADAGDDAVAGVGCEEAAAGTEFWDDSLPDTLGNEHTSHVVMSSWFWNVQRLQVHCSPVLRSPPPPPPPGGWFAAVPAGADSDRPSSGYGGGASFAGVEGSCWCKPGGILGGGGRGGRGGRFAIEPAGRIGDPSILSACRPSAMEEWCGFPDAIAAAVVSSAESTSFCIRSASWRRN